MSAHGYRETQAHRQLLAEPFACLDAEGWTSVNMQQARRLIHFCHANDVIQSVLEVCYNSLLTDTITVERAKAGGGGGEEGMMAARSRVWGLWAREAALMESACGFFLARGVPCGPEDADTGLEWLPSLLSFDQIQIQFRISVDSKYVWRVYETRPGGDSVSRVDQGSRLLTGYRVFGTSLPDAGGGIRSKCARIYDGGWWLLQEKTRLTIQADQERVRPIAVTEAVQDKHDPKLDKSTSDPRTEQGQADMEARYSESMEGKASALRAHLSNCSRPVADSAAAASASARGQDQSTVPGTIDQFNLAPGRVYVNATQCEAPLDLATSRMAFLESVALSFGVPLSMLSSGDSSGKAKLNGRTASAETAQIFKDSQEQRRKQAKIYIAALCQHLHHDGDALEFTKGVMTERMAEQERRKKRPKSSRKRKAEEQEPEAAPDEQDLMADREQDERDGLTAEAMRRQTAWSVSIPVTARLEDLLLLGESGLLEDEAFRMEMARTTGLPVARFKKSQKLSDDQQIVYGKQEKPEPAAAGGKKKAKKK